MKLNMLCGAAFAALVLAPDSATADVEGSLRASAWSGSRAATSGETAIINLEAWGRSEWRLADNLDLHIEGWAALDPIADGSADADVRDAYLSWRHGPLRINVGRQIFAWGRADRLNPTDVLGARDYRRLVEDEADTRLGLASITGRLELAGGELSLVWAPEFRATELPQTFAGPDLRVVRESPDATTRQFAVRYERFGRSIDWSTSYAEIYDTAPWLSLSVEPGAAPTLTLFHPRFRMLGADAATTWVSFGVRAEAALYDYDVDALRGSATRVPTFAAAIGVDRDFSNSTNVNVQLIVHGARAASAPSASQAIALRNDVIQYAWRDTVVGGLLRVRRTFAQDRGSFELSAAAFGGGGEYQQARLGYVLTDGVRLIAMGERFGGDPSSLFGKLEDNTLITLGVRLGF